MRHANLLIYHRDMEDIEKNLKLYALHVSMVKKHRNDLQKTKIAVSLPSQNAKVAQLVEHNLAKVRVAGSSPVFRSFVLLMDARMVEW